MPVTSARLAFLSSTWREAAAVDNAVQIPHLLAPQTTEESLLTDETDAQAEADRRQTIRGVRRDRFEIVVPLDETTDVIDLGDVVSLTHSRYGLSAGKLFRVLGVDPHASKRTLKLTLWG